LDVKKSLAMCFGSLEMGIVLAVKALYTRRTCKQSYYTPFSPPTILRLALYMPVVKPAQMHTLRRKKGIRQIRRPHQNHELLNCS
jgi:hypothetical protein